LKDDGLVLRVLSFNPHRSFFNSKYAFLLQH
jgi:hypothetical protein